MMLVTVNLFLLVVTTTIAAQPISQERRCGRVHLTVSSFSKAYLELNWLMDCNNSTDVRPAIISLFDKDPHSREELHPLETIRPSSYPSGFYKTRVKFRAPILPGNWEYRDEDLVKVDPGKHCFPYWIVSFAENGAIIDHQCFAIQPTWMSDNKAALLQKPLDSILIPGTHNSGAYDGSQLPQIFQSYLLNQDRLIWTQLVFGIRYLDLRIGYYKTGGFYINHDKMRITPLLPVLKQIRRFMELTEEIVILDFHRFPQPTDFNEELHKSLTDMIYAELGAFAAPRTRERIVFGKLWDEDKRLIIAYNNFNTIRERPWLWDGISQHWANTVNVAVLKDFLQSSIRNNPGRNRLWALMAELTPRMRDVLLFKNKLRTLADMVNRELTKWFRDEWERLSVNIVATDFFLGNDLINVAIEEIK